MSLIVLSSTNPHVHIIAEIILVPDGRNCHINSEPSKSLCYFSLYIIDYFSII